MTNHKIITQKLLQKIVLLLLLFLTLLSSTYLLNSKVYAQRPWTETFPYQKPDGFDNGSLSHIISVTEKKEKDGTFTITITLNTDFAKTPADLQTLFTNGGKLVVGTSDYTPSSKPAEESGSAVAGNFEYIGKGTSDTRVVTLTGLTNNKKTKYLTFTTYEDGAGPAGETVIRGYIWDLDTGDGATGEDDGNWVLDPGPGTGESSVISEPFEMAAFKPHVIVESYSFGTSTIAAGQTFNLTFTLKNTSNQKDVDNIIIVLTPSDDLSIRSGSNTIFIREIKKGATITQTVSLKLKVKTEAQVQKLNIATKFEYYDKKDTDPAAGEDTVDIAIASGKITSGKIASVGPSKKFKQKEEGNIEYSVVNNGFSTLHNVEAFIYDKEEKEIGWFFIGNLEPGAKSETPKVKVTFEDFGDQELLLKIIYQDENLASHEIKKDFIINVEEVPEEPELPYEPEEPFEPEEPEEPEVVGLTTLQKVLIGAGGLVLLIIIIVIINKLRKSKDEKFDDFLDAFPTAMPDDGKKAVADDGKKASKKEDKK